MWPLAVLGLLWAALTTGREYTGGECECTNDNSAIPEGHDMEGSDIGKFCKAWDETSDLCDPNWEDYELKNEEWCRNEWCYVKEDCWRTFEGKNYTSTQTVYHTQDDVQLFWSYETCGYPNYFSGTWNWTFSSCPKRMPKDVYFLVDSSGSVANKWDDIKRAMVKFILNLNPNDVNACLNDALDCGDRAALILFGGTKNDPDDDNVKVLETLTYDLKGLAYTAGRMKRLQSKIGKSAHTWTWTGIKTVINEWDNEPLDKGNQKLFFIITDGKPDPPGKKPSFTKQPNENPCDYTNGNIDIVDELRDRQIKTIIFTIGDPFDSLDCLVEDVSKDIINVPDPSDFFNEVDDDIFCTETKPTPNPTPEPTHLPSHQPTLHPTHLPTHEPTEEPTPHPTPTPSHRPTNEPTHKPTHEPTHAPTQHPTPGPTARPTDRPTHQPTVHPTDRPTHRPTEHPTPGPTMHPTPEPTDRPTHSPTDDPTHEPTDRPTQRPTNHPTDHPTPNPTMKPTARPTNSPTMFPTGQPTQGCIPYASQKSKFRLLGRSAHCRKNIPVGEAVPGIPNPGQDCADSAYMICWELIPEYKNKIWSKEECEWECTRDQRCNGFELTPDGKCRMIDGKPPGLSDQAGNVECWIKEEDCNPSFGADDLNSVMLNECYCPIDLADSEGYFWYQMMRIPENSRYCNEDEPSNGCGASCVNKKNDLIRRAQANRMFHLCQNWCLFDVDDPYNTFWIWDMERFCWTDTRTKVNRHGKSHHVNYCKNRHIRVNNGKGSIEFNYMVERTRNMCTPPPAIDYVSYYLSRNDRESCGVTCARNGKTCYVGRSPTNRRKVYTTGVLNKFEFTGLTGKNDFGVNIDDKNEQDTRNAFQAAGANCQGIEKDDSRDGRRKFYYPAIDSAGRCYMRSARSKVDECGGASPGKGFRRLCACQ